MVRELKPQWDIKDSTIIIRFKRLKQATTSELDAYLNSLSETELEQLLRDIPESKQTQH